MSKRKSNLSEDRTSFKPFNYPWAYDAWLKHEQSHWLHSEVPMAEDVKIGRISYLKKKNNSSHTSLDSSHKVISMLQVVM
jgi:ribonucleotide reductase beta subunit family protein with ferritin-like domain